MNKFLILIFLALITSGQSKIYMSFSGGGIRATIGTFIATRIFNEIFQPETITYGISGGTWGQILSRTNLTVDELYANLEKFINNQPIIISNDEPVDDNGIDEEWLDTRLWGPKVPKMTENGWTELWRHEIVENIFKLGDIQDVTWDDLHGNHYQNDFFVFSEVNKNSRFVDQCHFTFDKLVCLKGEWDKLDQDFPMEKLDTINNLSPSLPFKNTKFLKYTPIRFIPKFKLKKDYITQDLTLATVLTYSSSAWACDLKGKSVLVKKNFNPIKPNRININGENIFVADGGCKLNIPVLFPLLEHLDDQEDNVILNFDFSDVSEKKGKHALRQFEKMQEFIDDTKIPANLDFKKLYSIMMWELKDKPWQDVKINNIKFVNIPLRGKTLGFKLVDDYPTRKGLLGATQWSLYQISKFIYEWKGYLEEIKPDVMNYILH